MIPAARLRQFPCEEAGLENIFASSRKDRQLRFWRRLALVMTINAIILGCVWFAERTARKGWMELFDYVLDHPEEMIKVMP